MYNYKYIKVIKQLRSIPKGKLKKKKHILSTHKINYP